VACKATPKPDAAVTSAPDRAPSTHAVSAAPSASPASSAAASADRRPPLTPAQAKAYQGALARGRLATTREQYPEAIDAFTEALAASKDDPRAYSERGYAELRADRPDAADDDLQRAVGHFSDPKLEAQIWFNLGLVAEARGKADRARLAFARSFQLNPLKAAADKLSGKSTCATEIDKTSVPPKRFPTWLAAWNALGAAEGKNESPPVVATDEPSARAAFGAEKCGDACIGRTAFGTSFHLLMPRKDGAIDVLPEIAEGYYYRCGGPPDVSLAADAAGLLHVSVANVMLEATLAPCTPSGTCGMACSSSGTWIQNHVYVDPTTHARVLFVGQTGMTNAQGESGAKDIVVDETGVTLTGAGCQNRHVAFAGP
jgi:hypothetical protein